MATLCNGFFIIYAYILYQQSFVCAKRMYVWRLHFCLVKVLDIVLDTVKATSSLSYYVAPQVSVSVCVHHYLGLITGICITLLLLWWLSGVMIRYKLIGHQCGCSLVHVICWWCLWECAGKSHGPSHQLIVLLTAGATSDLVQGDHVDYHVVIWVL